MASCLRPFLADQLKDNQFCGVTGNSILDAVSTVREVLARSKTTGTPLCILTLDFNGAFNLFPTNA
jgi:hypothetical protein